MAKKINIEGIIGWDVTAAGIRRELRFANGEDIDLEIATPGGLISEGINIYNLLNNYQGTVNTHLMGEVASMGTYIAMVGKKRTAEKNAVFFIHNGWGLAVGDHRVMFKMGDHLDSLTNIIAKEYAEKTPNSLEEMRSAMDEETFYYGDEIKDAGFVHEIVGDAEPAARAEAIAKTRLMVDECQAKINTPEIVKNELKVLSVMFKKDSNEPVMKITQFDDNAELKDQDWSKPESEKRWRKHADVEDSDDLPNKKYDQRFVWIGDSKSLTDRKFPIWDFKNSEEFVNISAVRNGLSRLPQSDISESDKRRVKSVLKKYLDKFNKEQDNTNNNNKTEGIMNLEELKTKHPDLYNQVKNEGIQEGMEKGIKDTRTHAASLIDLRGKFTKPHSHKVIDEGIKEGHDMSEVVANLMAADQANNEVKDGEKDNPDTPANGDNVPEMKDGEMVHTDHVDAKSKELSELPGVL